MITANFLPNATVAFCIPFFLAIFKAQYDPELGRFISPNPEEESLNLYQYVFNQPFTYTDPYGLDTRYLGWVGNEPFPSSYECNQALLGFSHGAVNATYNTFNILGKYAGGGYLDDFSLPATLEMRAQASLSMQVGIDNTFEALGADPTSCLYRFTYEASYIGTDFALSAILFPPISKGAAAIKGASAIIPEAAIALKTISASRRVFQPYKTIIEKNIWSATNNKNSVENAFWHWQKLRREFPDIGNIRHYIAKTRNFLSESPPGTLMKTRLNGGIVLYHPETNTFATFTKEGVPRTLFKPDISWHKYSTNLEYFNAQ